MALATYLRGDIGAGGDPVDDALLASWTAVAYWTLVRPDDARPWAVLAREIAERSGSDRAMAAAMSAVGAVARLDGDPSRCVEAYGPASRQRNARATACSGPHPDRSRVQPPPRGSVWRGAGRARSRAQARRRPQPPDLRGPRRDRAVVRAHRARPVRGGAGGRPGRPGRLRPDRVALGGVRDAERRHGRRAAGRHRPGARGVRGRPARLRTPRGLAHPRLRHRPPGRDRGRGRAERAAALVDEAMSISRASQLAVIPLVAARVAMAAGDRALASERVAATLEVAQRRRDRPSLASAMELSAELAALDGDRAAAARSLERAGAVRAELGSAYGQATHDLVRARVLGGDAGRASALAAAAAFRSLGARSMAGEAEDVATRIAAAGTSGIDIRALGTFRVLRGGEPVPTGEWQSKRARSLLKVLIARRGHAVTREELCEVLWPEVEPVPCSTGCRWRSRSCARSSIRTGGSPRITTCAPRAMRCRWTRRAPRRTRSGSWRSRGGPADSSARATGGRPDPAGGGGGLRGRPARGGPGRRVGRRAARGGARRLPAGGAGPCRGGDAHGRRGRRPAPLPPDPGPGPVRRGRAPRARCGPCCRPAATARRAAGTGSTPRGCPSSSWKRPRSRRRPPRAPDGTRRVGTPGRRIPRMDPELARWLERSEAFASRRTSTRPAPRARGSRWRADSPRSATASPSR